MLVRGSCLCGAVRYEARLPFNKFVQCHCSRCRKATGSAFARFKLPPGATGDPIVRFDFSGEFQPARRQVFDLVTAEGAKGTVELIPGPAFNLLEVNFQTEMKPGKIRQADVVLVKK